MVVLKHHFMIPLTRGRTRMSHGKLTVAVVLTLAALIASASGQSKHVLRLSSPVSKDHAFGRGAEKFKQLVEEATKGQVELQVHHANALGSIREGLEMVRLGTLDFQVCGVAHVSRFVPEMNTLVLPYLWKDTATMFVALDGRMGQILEALLLEKGFKLAGWWDNGFRHVSNNKRPVRTPEDLRGLKLRTLPTKVHVTFFRALGVSPTPMDWAEVYPALQQGVVDGQENPPGVVYFEKLAEVQKFYSLTGHVNEPVNVLMSRAVFAKLPADQQAAIMTAAKQAALWQRVESQKDNDELLKKISAAGMQVNAVPDATLAELRKVAQKIYAESIPDLGSRGKELVDIGIALNK
jgi:tripartite ATP-independent transporter DctP family solute receptor